MLGALGPLRERIADRFTRRGLATSADQILITNGAQHAFALVLRMLVSPGERVLVEQPTYVNALPAIEAAHALPVAVPLTEAGWDSEAFEATLRQAAPRVAYLIPDFHNPTGMRLDAAGRERLAVALRRSRTTAVIDETLVELDFSDEPAPPPFASYAEDNVITTGSASKAFWGGLRLGWVRAPAELIRHMIGARSAIDLGSPVLEQLVLTELLEDPEPALVRRRADILVQRDRLAALLRQNCPQWKFKIPDGGLALWCRLPGPISTRLVLAAKQQGVRLVPGSRFAVHGSLESRLRVPYTLSPQQLEDAVARLVQAVKAVGPAGEIEDLESPAT